METSDACFLRPLRIGHINNIESAPYSIVRTTLLAPTRQLSASRTTCPPAKAAPLFRVFGTKYYRQCSRPSPRQHQPQGLEERNRKIHGVRFHRNFASPDHATTPPTQSRSDLPTLARREHAVFHTRLGDKTVPSTLIIWRSRTMTATIDYVRFANISSTFSSSSINKTMEHRPETPASLTPQPTIFAMHRTGAPQTLSPKSENVIWFENQRHSQQRTHLRRPSGVPAATLMLNDEYITQGV